jgi:hypothetical protein
MPGLAFMLLFAIGDNGGGGLPAAQCATIPDEIQLPNKPKFSNGEIACKKAWKVRTIITNALQSCLDVVMFSRKSEGFSEQDLEELDVLVARMRMHMLELYALRRDLKHIDKGIPTHKRIDKLFNGHKHHLCEHLSQFIRWFGIKKNFDTQRSERYHVYIKSKTYFFCFLIILCVIYITCC